MTKLSTISKARAADLDARVLTYLRRRGDAGALPSQIREDLAARATWGDLVVSLGRLERAGLVRKGERQGSEGQPRIAVQEAPTAPAGTTTPTGGKAAA